MNSNKHNLSAAFFNFHELNIEHYIKFGRFGTFHYCKQRKDNRYYFLRVLKKSVIIDRNTLEKIHKEIQILEKIKDIPFISPLIGLSTNDPRFLGLLFDFIPGGKLRSILKEKKELPLESAKFYFGNALLIIENLHKRKIIYRDLKPENLLIKENGYLTLLDFSYAKELQSENDKTFSLCGTPNYLAPEIILNKGYNYSVDYWSLGVFLYEMLAGIDPFHNKDPMIIYQNILTNKLFFPPKIDRDAKTLISHLLVPDPNKRYGCLKNGPSDIKNHRLYNDFRWRTLMEQAMEPPFKPKIEVGEPISKFYDKEKINIKLKEKYDKDKEEYERLKKEMQENKNPKANKVQSSVEGAEIIDSDTEAREIAENEDPFMQW